MPPSVRAAQDRRSRRHKSRLAAVSAASMLAVGGAAGMSIAMAEEGEAGREGEIVFSGSCGALDLISPTSSPSTTELKVAEGATVTYTNNLGTGAELHVGTDTYTITSGTSQDFVMNRSAEVAMIPDCHGLFAEYGSAEVIVVEAAPQSDTAGSPEPDSAELPSTGGTSNDSSKDSSDSGSSNSDASDSSTADDSSSDREDMAGGTGEARSGEQGEDAAAAEPEPGTEDEDVAEEDEVFSFGLLDEDEGTTEFTPASDEVTAVDPKVVKDGASGLLALVAIVALVGVSAAVTRTLLRQRAAA